MKTIISLLLLLLISQYSCSTTEPEEKKVSPPDTTSQNFSFETVEFGDGYGSSLFKDVWVFDENNIWAVGDLDLDGNYTNIMRWDGKKWFAQMPYITSSGLSGIWAADSSNIYFACGAVAKYESGKISIYDLGPLDLPSREGVEKIWGSSEKNIWAVGHWGTIVHFDGKEWKKIDFDESYNFYGITGSKETGTAYTVGAINHQTVIVELKDLNARIIYNESTMTPSLSAYDIEMINENELLLSNADIWKYNIEKSQAEIFQDLEPGYFLPRIGYNKENDVFFWGNKLNSGEKLIHYNGKRIKEIDLPIREYVIYGNIYWKNNVGALAAFSNNKAYLVKIKRL